MTVDSPVQLVALLAGKQPKAVIGTPESDWVDFKVPGPNGPYDLGTDKGKFELAKDVAGFANAGGGLIVCGFRAKRKANELYEMASQVAPFDKRLVNVDRYKDVISEYVRPLVKVTYTWFDHPEDDPDASGHYLVIEVAPLPEDDRWALITRSLSEDEKFVTGSWTVPIRHGDDTMRLQADTVYRLLNDGHRAWRRQTATAPQQAPADPAERRYDLRTLLRLDDVPVLFFQSTPSRPKGLIDGLHAPGGLGETLNKQDTLRGRTAFNFSPELSRPEPHDGGYLLADPPRRGLLVGPEGHVTAAAAADSDMLGWAVDRYDTGRLAVFVLTELTLEYFRLVDRHILPLVDGPWTHRIVAVDFKREPARSLVSGDDRRPVFAGDGRPATSDDWNHAWQASGDPERDAYEALRRLYPLFGLDVTVNPFVDGHTVSTKKLLAKQF
jgi:hypothetical protein